MLRILTLGFAVTLSGLAATTAVAAADPVEQKLSIDLRGSQPLIQHLSAYESDAPIHVRVLAPSAERIALQGLSPDGSAVDILLVRGADGAFAGDLPLGTSGDWSLAVNTTVSNQSSLTDRFTVTAVDAPSTGTASLMIALAGMSVFGGVGLLAYGRRASTRIPG